MPRPILSSPWAPGMLALLVATTGALAQGPAASAEDLRITLGKSMVIDYPVDVSRISTSNPDIVDAVAVSTREILLHAKAMGVSTIVVWSRTGQRTFYNVSVDQNLEPVRRLVRETFPGEEIQILGTKDSLTLVGRASSKEVNDRAAALAASLAKTVVNNLRVAAPAVEKQVLLRVKFGELDRTRGQQIGVNLFSTGFGNTPAAISTGQFSPPKVDTVKGGIPGSLPGFTTEFNVKDLLNIFAFRPDLNLGAMIKALQNESVLQILAEPNLVTTVGKEASFLVGGEFPIPVLQGGANSSAVTVQFREFGIRLTFNPILTDNGTLKMHVKPEVSTIDLANAVVFNGFTIPALATRRMETDIELRQGQSFVIGGLVDDRVNEQLSKIPGLSSIPILGALFKSRIENKSKTELVVIVTPEIVDPLDPVGIQPTINYPLDWLPPAPTKKGAEQSAAPTPGTNKVAEAELSEQQVIIAKISPPRTNQEVVGAGAPVLSAPSYTVPESTPLNLAGDSDVGAANLKTQSPAEPAASASSTSGAQETTSTGSHTQDAQEQPKTE